MPEAMTAPIEIESTDRPLPATELEDGARQPLPATEPEDGARHDGFIESELLVEDISIDGMCGVY